MADARAIRGSDARDSTEKAETPNIDGLTR